MIATVVGSVLATLSACFGIAGGVALYVLRKPKPIIEAEEPAKSQVTAYMEVLASRVAELEVKMVGMPSLWEEERDRAKKHADRAAAAYRSAEQVLDIIKGEDPDAGEDQDLHDDDGGGGGFMPTLFDDVAGAGQRASEEADVRDRARRHLAANG